MNANRLIDEAYALLGTPFRHQGRLPVVGLDCVGLLLVAGSRAGVLHAAEQTDYGRAPNIRMEERLAVHCERLVAIEPGAVVAIRWPGDRLSGHVAIIAHDGIMIHAYSAAGAVVAHGYRGHWPRWTKSIWWIKGLARG